MNKVLVIYTGGTIGMIEDSKSGSLTPIDFSNINKNIPELASIDAIIDIISLQNPIDSSNMNINIIYELSELIYNNYHKYFGIVILHGSDTMAYTASVLSFIFQNLDKPIILTGSQLPIGKIRTDGKENFITAVEIASSNKKLSEVCIYFEYKLYRGNRTTKISSTNFKAFESMNYPILAEAGVNIYYNEKVFLKKSNSLNYFPKMDNSFFIIYFFPGIDKKNIEQICDFQNIRALILVTYGSGNLDDNDDIIKYFDEFINKKNKIILNITQCLSGSVFQGKYKTSIKLNDIGVVSGYDMTIEAASSKLMHLLAYSQDNDEVKHKLSKNLVGELSKRNELYY